MRFPNRFPSVMEEGDGFEKFDDNEKIIFGTGNDAELYFNASDLYCDMTAGRFNVNVPGSTVALAVSRAGVATGYLQPLAGSFRLATPANKNLELVPGGSGITIVGDAGSTSHTLNTNDDLFIAGELEVDGKVYFDGAVHYPDANSNFIGNGLDSGFRWASDQTNHSLLFFTDVDNASYSGNIIFTTKDNRVKDHDLGTVVNPTMIIFSATDPDTANNQWTSITHDQTDGVIDCGTGTLNLGATGNVNFAGATATASTVTHDAYVELEVAGVVKKFMVGS